MDCNDSVVYDKNLDIITTNISSLGTIFAHTKGFDMVLCIKLRKKLFVGTVPSNKKLFVGTVPTYNFLFVGTLIYQFTLHVLIIDVPKQ